MKLVRTIVLLVLLGQPAVSESLTLDAVLASVAQNHPKIRGAEITRQVASAKVTEKQGAFDTQLGFSSAYQRYNSSSSPGKARDYVTLGGTAFRTDPSGVKWEAGWLNHQGAIKSPQSSTGDVGEFFVGAKVPLLRGLNVNEKSTALRQAKLLEERVRYDYQLIRLMTLLDAGSAFYDWVTVSLQEKVVRENLALAQERAHQVEKSIEAGDRARIDQVEADREVVKRQELLRKAERSVQKQAFKLAFYLWNSEGKAQDVPSADQAPKELTLPPEELSLDIAQAQIRALEQRPELKRLKISKSIISLDRNLAQNQRLPILDLAIRPGFDAGGSGIGFTMKAGLELVIPLATRTADGKERAASLKLDKLSLEQVEMLRRILLQVEDASSQVRATKDRLAQALDIYKLARELEQAERKKFAFGDSSLFLVNSRERSTVEAALKVLGLRNELAQALLLSKAVEGSL